MDVTHCVYCWRKPAWIELYCYPNGKPKYSFYCYPNGANCMQLITLVHGSVTVIFMMLDILMFISLPVAAHYRALLIQSFQFYCACILCRKISDYTKCLFLFWENQLFFTLLSDEENIVTKENEFPKTGPVIISVLHCHKIILIIYFQSFSNYMLHFKQCWWEP